MSVIMMEDRNDIRTYIIFAFSCVVPQHTRVSPYSQIFVDLCCNHLARTDYARVVQSPSKEEGSNISGIFKKIASIISFLCVIYYSILNNDNLLTHTPTKRRTTWTDKISPSSESDIK